MGSSFSCCAERSNNYSEIEHYKNDTKEKNNLSNDNKKELVHNRLPPIQTQFDSKREIKNDEKAFKHMEKKFRF